MNTNQALPVGAADSTIQDPRQRRAILLGVCLALMAVIASVSGLNVAQPQLALAFDASQGTVSGSAGSVPNQYRSSLRSARPSTRT